MGLHPVLRIEPHDMSAAGHALLAGRRAIVMLQLMWTADQIVALIANAESSIRIASTCSTTGAFRLRDDVLIKGPVDLFFIEFAVNDDQDAGHALNSIASTD